MGSGRGPAGQVAEIVDAIDVGVSQYANAIGECFFTVPYNHPQISAISPLQTHYEIARLNQRTLAWDVLGVGILDGYKADANEVTATGRDYLSLLDTSITSSTTSYTTALVGTIINNEWTIAKAQVDSRLAFVTTGTINATSQTATVISAYESRLHFMRGAINILTASNSTRPIMQISRSSPHTFSFNQNQGSLKPAVRLEYGGLISDFKYDPGYATLASDFMGIGQKRVGATILYSERNWISFSTYGLIQVPKVYIDVTDQAALDAMVIHDARVSARIGKGIAVQIEPGTAGGLQPWDGYDVGDALTTIIQRGIVNVNGPYTCWGQEWVADKGGESLFLDLLPLDP